jgi:hypothetical protein
MTFADLKDKTAEYLSFGNYSDVQPSPNLAVLVNEAYREIATESEFNWEATSFATVAGTAEYTLTNPPDWIRITDVLWGTSTVLYQADPIQVRRYDPLWTQAANAQSMYWWVPKPNVIRLYAPPSSVVTINVYGSRDPTAFTADTDVPGFPIRYHEAIPLRAAWLHLKKVATGEEMERAKMYLTESDDKVATLKEEIGGQNNPVARRRVTRRSPEYLYLGSRLSERY